LPPSRIDLSVTTDRRKLKAQRHADGKLRCAWCPEDPLYVAYHDDEWGVPVRADGALFEMLCLEGAQAGLSWITVLRKPKPTDAPSTASMPKKCRAITP
jgi:DNA-3-methyladenine glycosylase I